MAKRIENILVDEHMTHDPRFGYNKTHGGELEIPSKETCDKISAALKEYYENHPEAREARSVATKEAMKRPDVRQKIIDAHKGKPLSEEHRQNISDALKGHEISEETRNKISEAKKKPVEAINPKTGLPSLYFDSAMSAGRLGFSYKKISKCCHGKQKTHKGYEWRFVEGGEQQMTVIIEDSRQKRGKHEEKRQYFLDQGHIVVRQQMKWGDYGLYPSVVVDTKQDIIEIAQNLCGNISERNRFAEEMKGAKLAGIKLVFLIEDKRFREVSDLYETKMKLHSGKVVRGEQLATAMSICEARYGCEFQFCSPDEAGYRIIEILEGGK